MKVAGGQQVHARAVREDVLYGLQYMPDARGCRARDALVNNCVTGGLN